MEPGARPAAIYSDFGSYGLADIGGGRSGYIASYVVDGFPPACRPAGAPAFLQPTGPDHPLIAQLCYQNSCALSSRADTSSKPQLVTSCARVTDAT
jgi:hypothetical protein